MEIKIFSNWKKDIEKTWSGTSFGLLKALSQKYDVTIVHPAQNLILQFFKRFMHRVPLFSYCYYAIQDFYVKRQLNRKDNILMVSESVNAPCTSFIFLDNIWFFAKYSKVLSKDPNFQYNEWSFKDVCVFASEKHLAFYINRQYKIMENSKAIFCMGNWLKKLIVDTYPELSNKVYVTNGGINTSGKYKKESNCKSMKILFVGRDFYRKGGDLVAKAFSVLYEKYPQLELHVTGPQQRPKEISEKVKFWGDVSNDVVEKLMDECDVFCMPSRFEAYGLVFAEALVHGMPIVARNAFEMPYFVEKGVTGELINKDSVEELCLALEKTLLNKNYKENVKKRHDIYCQKYSWNSVANIIDNVIKM